MEDRGFERLGAKPPVRQWCRGFSCRNYGITSHSTPVDLLYNFGLIGCTLFYAIFACMFWRLYRMSDRRLRSLRATLIGATVCYLFITLSPGFYYCDSLPPFSGSASGLHAATSR